MADVMETVKDSNVTVEYDDPYADAPFFSEETLSAKIEKSPVLIFRQTDETRVSEMTTHVAEPADTSCEIPTQEQQGTDSFVSLNEEKLEESACEKRADLNVSTKANSKIVKDEIEEICYENFPKLATSEIESKKSDTSLVDTPADDLSNKLKQQSETDSLSSQNDIHDYDNPDNAIYDAPWDLGALQKGLEEKLKMNKQCSQDEAGFYKSDVPHKFVLGQKDSFNSSSSSSSSLKTTSAQVNSPPGLTFHHQARNSPEYMENIPKHQFKGSDTRRSLKGKSPLRKCEPNQADVLELSRSDQLHMNANQKRPLPSCPISQPQIQHLCQSFNYPQQQNCPSNSLVLGEHQQHHHPLQRRGVPVMGGGSVGRGVHQQKVANVSVAGSVPQADWRPLEDYDSPWDNKQRDLISSFNQESMGLRSSIKRSVQPNQQTHQASLAEKIGSRLPLEEEWWYHGPITRQEAEKRLCNEREGSYLIRNSESNRLDYSLSIKSSSGCIHLKIVPNNEGKFILGQFSQPFASVAQMIYHYTVNKLPIRGAEHMSLTFPVGH